jgi:ribosomal protein L44E
LGWIAFILVACLNSEHAFIYGSLAALCAGIYSVVVLRLRCSSCGDLIMKRKYDRSGSPFQILRPTWRILIPKKCDACGHQLFIRIEGNEIA